MMRTVYDPIEGRSSPEHDGGVPLQYASDTSGEATEDQAGPRLSASYNPPAIIPRDPKGRQRSLTADAPTARPKGYLNSIYAPSAEGAIGSGRARVNSGQIATPASLPAGVGRQDHNDSPISKLLAACVAADSATSAFKPNKNQVAQANPDGFIIDDDYMIFGTADHSPPRPAAVAPAFDNQARIVNGSQAVVGQSIPLHLYDRNYRSDALVSASPDHFRSTQNNMDIRKIYDRSASNGHSNMSQATTCVSDNYGSNFQHRHPADWSYFGNVGAVHLPTPNRPLTGDAYDAYGLICEVRAGSPAMAYNRNLPVHHQLVPQQTVSPPPGIIPRGPRLSNATMYGTQYHPNSVNRFFPTDDRQNMSHIPDPIVNIEHGVSVNYQGNAALERNQSEIIPEDINCAFWITGLAPDTTHRELLATIRNTGRVYALVINKPVGTHQTSAAKIIFFDLDAAQAFHARTVREGFVVRGYQGHVSKNRIKTSPKDQEGQRDKSRVLVIKGDPKYVNPDYLTAVFSAKFKFEVDEVVVRELNAHIGHIEYRFGSYRCQAEAGFQVLKREFLRGENNPNGPVWYLRWGRDPCDVFRAAFGTSQWFEHATPAARF